MTWARARRFGGGDPVRISTQRRGDAETQNDKCIFAPLRLCASALLLLLPACDVLPKVDLQRMINQDKFTTWQHSAYFEDGRVMRTPPEGSLPRDVAVGDPALTEGVVSGAYVAQVPIPVTRDLLIAGRARFETYCAPCHGLRADGESWVALNMDLRRPPPLVGPGGRALPEGRIYQVINEGYGLMRSYAEDLISPEERWAVVAYLRALQLHAGVPFSSLPPDARERAQRELQ